MPLCVLHCYSSYIFSITRHNPGASPFLPVNAGVGYVF
ncbi:hypothetical protein L248_0281 [Schleiferilactobacillus shenzhenensis LY-73]|uniref:Uncharacterized protein n=1 Tax=Schleiferilactobacillus shenzhenensis LY-73 TaxID=1231336 RepID=U4TNY2_9LACO|nr:hypothetical protein L248_0281 [Schleiferilactobacillus shenzhenensis LY-73]